MMARCNESISVKHAMALLCVFLMPVSQAALETACADVKKVMTWAEGTDRFGIQVQLTDNGEHCSGGYYIKHEASNKRYVSNVILTSMALERHICIQYESKEAKLEGRCRLNMVSLEK